MDYREIAKKFLLQYRKAENEMRDLDMQVEDLTADIDSISVKLDGMPKGTEISDRTGSLATKLADCCMRAIEKRSVLWDLRCEIEDEIHKLDVTPARILSMRYIHGEKFEKIACEVNLSWKQMWRVYNKALTDIGKNIEKRQK